MTVIYFQSDDEIPHKGIRLNKEETLLDGLLRHGHKIPFGCKEGICQGCIMQATQGKAPKNSQRGLKSTQIEQNYFLACQCFPEQGFNVRIDPRISDITPARVLEKKALNGQILRLRIEPVVDYRPGQFMSLWNNNKISRSYSTASTPSQEDFIEFHIKHIANGAFSSWAWNNLQENDLLNVQGPLGGCFYTISNTAQPIFLSGIGTGLAPLYGIVRDALNQGHEGEITLFLGSKNFDGFYLVDELLALQDRFNNFSVTFIAQNTGPQILPGDSGFISGDIYQLTQERIPDFRRFKIFLCGANSFVKKMKKLCFLSGASMSAIISDSFAPFQSPQASK